MPFQLTIQTLDEGWQDRDFILLHACFQCLVDCVEKENLLGNTRDWKHDDNTQTAYQELRALYDWWKQRIGGIEATGGIIDTESNQYKIDSEKLIQLIGLRSYLWT